jgi:murein DD-endopeptidase MepM/ murein hydrolase activator NlpD
MTVRQRVAGMRRLRLTFAYGSLSRTLAIPRGVAIAVLGVLPFVALLYLVATCYFVFHDDMLATLTRHQVEMQYAYEDRISGLRNELENATEQVRVDQADFADRVKALAARQDQVESRVALVAALAERMKSMRISDDKPSEIPALPQVDAPLAVANPQSDATLTAPSAPANGKPHPEGFDLGLRNGAGDESNSQSASPAARLPVSPIDFDSDLPVTTRIQLLMDRYDRVDREDLRILADLQQPANFMSRRIRSVLAAAGLTADQLSLPGASNDAKASGMGGPFVALPILSDGSAFASAAGVAEKAIERFDRLRSVLPHVPLEAPLPGRLEVTSGFGPRIDPFLGTPALHTGVDLLELYGAPVRATAAGRVVSAGFDGGYGNMVEIDHGNGLSTRYAHLSDIDVAPGQNVSLGTVLGHIGATGRATGPHLHYEVRIDGEPVDPQRFLRAGADLLADADDL